MRMFLVGMCDIFLILYLTSLSQVSPFNNSFLTVEDYYKLKEAKTQAEQDSEISKGQVLELKSRVSALDKEKEQALQLVLTTKAETEKAMQLVSIEKEKAVQAEIELSKTISKKEELIKRVQKSQEKEQSALKIVEEMQIEVEKAKKSEQGALKTVEELRLEAEKKEQFVIKIIEEAKLEAEKAEENEEELRRIAREVQLKAEEARKNEEAARRIAEEARLKAEEAERNEEIAHRIAEEEKLKAEEARQSETVALKLAEDAENQKLIALKNETKARKAETKARKAEVKALKVASVAQSKTAKVKSKIKSITQTTDKAYNENILDKLIQFTITVNYESRLEHAGSKVITVQGLPVKMGDDNVIFVLSERIALDSSLAPDHYISYNVTANGKPVRKLYIKSGEAEITALVIDAGVKHCLPVGKSSDFSTYMPVLFSIRSQQRLGIMDRIRGISGDFFVFKRDHLLMITRDEFYFDNEGFRGTGNYAEYIVKGDQIVDLDGNFIGFAYEKNRILRIDNLKGWREFPINDTSVHKPSKQMGWDSRPTIWRTGKN